jgi:hypothetical protein
VRFISSNLIGRALTGDGATLAKSHTGGASETIITKAAGVPMIFEGFGPASVEPQNAIQAWNDTLTPGSATFGKSVVATGSGHGPMVFGPITRRKTAPAPTRKATPVVLVKASAPAAPRKMAKDSFIFKSEQSGAALVRKAKASTPKFSSLLAEIERFGAAGSVA